MASSNLFAQYLRAPKSVNEYTAEMDDADMRREQLAGAKRKNALDDLVMRDTMDQRRRDAGIRQRKEGYIQQAGGDRNALLALYERDPDLMGEAGALRKADLDARNTESQIDERKAAADAKKFATKEDMRAAAIKRMAEFQSPDDARATIIEAVRNGELGMQDAQRVLSTMPQDPVQFPGWQINMLRGIMSAKDQLEQQQKAGAQAETARHNKATEGLTRRGQDVTAATAREGNDIRRAEVSMGGKPPPGYRWAGEGRLEAIPGGPGDKLPEAQQKQVIGTQNLSNAIGEYRDALASFGALDALKPDQRARMGTVYNNMLLQAKEAYNLGVLNGPDYQILQSVVTDPRSLKGAITSKEALDKQASELDRIMGAIGSTSSQRRPQDAQKPATQAGAFADADKERRYQEWKAKQVRQ